MNRTKSYRTSYKWRHQSLMIRQESILTSICRNDDFRHISLIQYSLRTNNTKMHVEDRKTKNKIEYAHSGNDTITRKQSIYDILHIWSDIYTNTIYFLPVKRNAIEYYIVVLSCYREGNCIQRAIFYLHHPIHAPYNKKHLWDTDRTITPQYSHSSHPHQWEQMKWQDHTTPRSSWR